MPTRVCANWNPPGFGVREPVAGLSVNGFQRRPLFLGDVNNFFPGRSSGSYVFVVQGRISDCTSNIQSGGTGGPPRFSVQIRAEIRNPTVGPTPVFTGKPHAVHQVMIDATGGTLSPVVSTQARGMPFFMVDQQFCDPSREWSLNWALAIPPGQTGVQGQSPAVAAAVTGLTITIWSLEELSALGIPWSYRSDTSDRSLGPSISTVMDDTDPSPGLGASDGDKWASFWSARVVPGFAETPFPSSAPAVVSSAPTAVIEGATVDARSTVFRGLHRKLGPTDDSTRIQTGGVNFHENWSAPTDRFRIKGSDPRGIAVVNASAQFDVRIGDLEGFGVANLATVDGGFQVWSDLVQPEPNTIPYELSFAGTAARERTYAVDAVASDVNFGFRSRIAPRGVGSTVLSAVPPTARRFVVRHREEPVPDCFIGTHIEGVGPMQVQVRGESYGANELDPSSSPVSDGIVFAEGFVALSWSNVHGIPNYVDTLTPDVPGPWTQLRLNRSTVDVSSLRPFPSPPVARSEGRIEDHTVGMETEDGTTYSWTEVEETYRRVTVNFLVDEKRTPGLLARWEEFFRENDMLAVRWKAPNTDAETAWLIDPSSLPRTGPVNGLWRFPIALLEVGNTEDP